MAEQNKKKTIGREEGVGGQEGISPSTPRTTWHPEMITFSSQPEIPTEIILSLKSFKGVTVGSLEKKRGGVLRHNSLSYLGAGW